MTEPELKATFDKLDQALSRLEAILKEPREKDYLLDATVQRYEFTYEMLWKTLQKALFARESIEARSPRETFRRAYMAGWLDDEDTWERALRYRNPTTHTYNQQLAEEAYRAIAEITPAIRAATDKLRAMIG